MNLPINQSSALHGLHKLLRMSKVRVTRATLRSKLWQHPEFPRLPALSDTLNELRVGNLAIDIGPDQLAEIPLPALAYLTSEGGFFAPVRATTAEGVEWWHHERGWQQQQQQAFHQHWNGVALLIEPTKESGEKNYAKSQTKALAERLRWPAALLCLLACVGMWANVYQLPPANAPLYYSLLLLKLIGLGVSCLLVWYSLDANSVFLRSLCQLNARTNCGAVLNTSAARLFPWLNWAEVGLFYFGGGLITLLLFHARPAGLYLLLLGSTLAALPYTFWSVYYQWQRARQWCVLCLTVQLTLWLEFVALMSFRPDFLALKSISKAEIALFGTGFLLLPAAWALLKPSLARAMRATDSQQTLQSLKFDPHYLASLRQRVRPLPSLAPPLRLPTLGNANAAHQLVVVTNPTCSACARVHLELEELMAQLDDVTCRFVVAVSSRTEDAGRAVAARVLSQPVADMPLALHAWYTNPDLQKWLQKTRILGVATTEAGELQLALHQQWCEQAHIHATPTILFNGIEIPRYYTTPEMRTVIRYLMTVPAGVDA